MPEGKIDAIGKADAASWSAVSLSKGSPNVLRIISGQLSHMPAGEVMSAVVQKAAKGAFKISLNGETFIIKGLPASLLGKAVSFVARQSSFAGKAGIELFWLGPSRIKNTGAQATAQQARPRAEIMSRLPADLLTHMKSAKVMSARLEHVQAGKMTMSLSVPDPKHPAKVLAHQIQTTVVGRLKQGQTVSVRMHAGIHNKVELEILPQQTIHQAATKHASKDALPARMATFQLAVGDVAAAMVQKRLPNGQVQLNIQGKLVETAAPESVAKGDVLLLRMSKAPAEFQLMSVQKNTADKMMTVLKSNLPVSHEALSQNMTTIRNLLPALINTDLPVNSALPALENWLAASVSSGDKPVNGERLGQLIRQSGTGMETKLLGLSQQAAHHPAMLHDLKALMLQLSNVQSSHASHAEIIRVLTELAQHSTARIETNQALNVLAQMHGDPIRFELPMLVGQQLVSVYMSVQQQYQSSSEEAEQGGGSEQSYSVLFALDLTGLGKMKVDASISDTSVHARIYADQAGVGQFIREHIQRLETRLQDLGYQEVFLLAAQTPPDAEKQRSFDQLTSMAPSSLNLLDVIA